MRTYQGAVSQKAKRVPRKGRGKGRLLIILLLLPALLLAAAWGSAAIWFDGPSTRWVAGLLSGLFATGYLLVLLKVRPFRRALLLSLAALALVIAWWLTIPPSNDRDWQTDVARPATAKVSGNLLTVRNVRNFDYRSETDYTQHWDNRTYDLDKLTGVDLFISFWGPTLIAHTITSWEFSDGSHLAVSIETRKEKGEEYSAVKGFFRQFELFYVVADERDVIRLRTNYRGEHVYLYRLRVPVELARNLLLDYMRVIDRLSIKPRWYNALTHNCTTAIRYHLKHLGVAQALNWRLIVNGHLDELLYMRGTVDRTLPFDEMRRQSEITERAKAADKASDFSTRIRMGLPGGRLPPSAPGDAAAGASR
jgi:hypothetical protein